MPFARASHRHHVLRNLLLHFLVIVSGIGIGIGISGLMESLVDGRSFLDVEII